MHLLLFTLPLTLAAVYSEYSYNQPFIKHEIKDDDCLEYSYSTVYSKATSIPLSLSKSQPAIMPLTLSVGSIATASTPTSTFESTNSSQSNQSDNQSLIWAMTGLLALSIMAFG